MSNEGFQTFVPFLEKVTCIEKTEDLKPEPVKKQSTISNVSIDQEAKETPQEELENKANEDLVLEDIVPESNPDQVSLSRNIWIKILFSRFKNETTSSSIKF